MIPFLEGCWRRRWVRGLMWAFITLVTLLILLQQGVNWLGARRWRDAQELVKREGGALDLRGTAPGTIPDKENFCAIPLLRDLPLAEEGATTDAALLDRKKRLDAIKLPRTVPNGGWTPSTGGKSGVALGIPLVLSECAAWLREDTAWQVPDTGDPAKDIMAAMAKHDSIFASLAAGLDRERAQWTPAWTVRQSPQPGFPKNPMAHWGPAQLLGSVLGWRAIAAARAHDATTAHESIQILLRLSQAGLDEPLGGWQLASAYNTTLAVNATWELCDVHAGSADDFRRLEEAFANLDFRKGWLQASRHHLALMIGYVFWCRETLDPKPMAFLLDHRDVQSFREDRQAKDGRLAGFLSKVMPAGFYDANAAAFAELYRQYFFKPLQDEEWPGIIRAVQQYDIDLRQATEHRLARPDYAMAALHGGETVNFIEKAAYAQCLANQAIIACALERHFATHGVYPDTLDAVRRADGSPLPLDPFSGKSIQYRKAPEGRYALWSVGVDGKDDGGKRVLDKNHPDKTRFYLSSYAGDWVWDFPPR